MHEAGRRMSIQAEKETRRVPERARPARLRPPRLRTAAAAVVRAGVFFISWVVV